MRIMTANIWGDYFGNPVELREDDLLTVYRRYSPDVIGFQEVTRSWHASSVFTRLFEDGYRSVMMERRGFVNFVPMTISDGFDLLAEGYEYLSDTPDSSKGITWAVLKRESDEKLFGVCNTHFWYPSTPEAELIRIKNAHQLVSVMKQLNGRFSCPVFAFGDFNCQEDSPAFDVFRESGILYLRDAAELKDDVSSFRHDPELGEDGKYHCEPADRDYRFSLDHIIALGDGFAVREYRVIEDTEALSASDHSPVFADIELL